MILFQLFYLLIEGGHLYLVGLFQGLNLGILGLSGGG